MRVVHLCDIMGEALTRECFQGDRYNGVWTKFHGQPICTHLYWLIWSTFVCVYSLRFVCVECHRRIGLWILDIICC